MSFDIATQFLFDATVKASLFALFGLSFSLIYSTTKIVHFAHGASCVAAAYAFFVAYVLLSLPLIAAGFLVIVFSAALGAAMMQYFYKPMIAKSASHAVIMIASLGLFIACQSIFELAFGHDSRVVSKSEISPGIIVGPIFITPLQVATIVCAIVLAGGLYLLIKRFKLGRALRAMSDDIEMATIIGVDISRLRTLVFAIGTAIASIPTMLIGLDVGISPTMGLHLVLLATIAAIVGGVRGIFTGVGGGLIVGATQTLGVIWIDPKWQNLVVFSVLLLVLMWKPTGLFAERR